MRGCLKAWTLGLGLLAAGLCPLAAFAQHPLLSSSARWLDVPDGEYNDIAVSPDGTRLYLLDAANDRVIVYNTTTDEVSGTIAFDRWLEGLALTPNGTRLVVAASEQYVYMVNTSTLAIIGSDDAWEFRGGPVAITPDNAVAYVAGSWDIYVVDLTAGGPEIIDTTPGDLTTDGLVEANTDEWTDFDNANGVLVSADGNTLFVPIWYNPYYVITGIANGTNHTDLPLVTQSLVHEYDPPLRLTLSADGGTLYDSYGVVRRASDRALLGRVSLYTDPEAITFDASMSPADVAVDPEGRYIYYAGFAWSYGQPDMATYGGEQLVVASHDDYEMIDLDLDDSNGLTCIRLPASPGGSSGTYSAHVMKISPDGDELYMAGGSSGVLVVELTHGGSGVWSVSPSRGGDDDVTLTITGGGFESGTTVSLERTGYPTISASQTSVAGATTLKAVFDLAGRAHGTYDVVLAAPGDSESRLTEAFTIETVRESASLEIIGEATLFSSGASSVHVVCHNTGNIDLVNPVISVQLTEGTQYLVELPATVPGGLTQLDDEFSEAVANHPEYVWVSRIAAQDSYSFWLHVAGPEGVAPLHWDVNLETMIGYLQSATDNSSAKLARRFSPIGDACTILDAAATNIHNEFAERGYEVEFEEVFDIIEDAFVQSAADYGVSKIEEVVARGLGQMVVLGLIPEAAPIYLIMFDGITDLRSCYLMYRTFLGFNALFAWDPNDKVSHTGVNGCIYGNETLRYIIHFENLPEATAAAEDVVITDTLDENLDYSTFVLVDSSHPSVLTTSLNTETGVLTFTFSGIDLPPNDTPPEGEGWVEYTIRPVANLTPGTQIRNQASIVFDVNDPIVTPEVVHTIDRAAPTSSVAALSAQTAGEGIALQWSGSDAGAGVMDYTVYVSVDGGAYSAWLSETTSTSATYEGAIGHRYSFYTIARDGLGNTESPPGQPDATTTLVAQGRGGCGATGPGGLVVLAAGMLGFACMRVHVRRCRSWERRSTKGT